MTIEYDDNGSMLTKDTARGNGTSRLVTYTYNLQNRLETVTTEEYDATPTLISTSVVTYTYNPQGIRTNKDVDGDTTFYHIDSQNHTGYAQVLEESTYDMSDPENPVFQESTTYTIGDDVISQSSTVSGVKHLLYDGHGSVRQDADITGTAQQSYDYDAYGNADGFTPSDGLYYCGEMWDASIDGYNLRAREYTPRTGRLLTVDTYRGNYYDPQSLHKYLYTHADPINRIDPSGHVALLMDLLTSFGLSEQIKSIKDKPNLIIRQGAEQVKDEIKDAFDWRDPMPIPRVAKNAEILWTWRLRQLGLNAIPLQQTPVGRHGPDMLAFGMINGKFHLVVGEVKGMKGSKVTSSLHLSWSKIDPVLKIRHFS